MSDQNSHLDQQEEQEQQPQASTSSEPLPSPAVEPPLDANGVPLSKRAQKRLVKQAKMEAERPLRRAREREIRKEKEKEKKRLIKEGVIEAPQMPLRKKARMETSGRRDHFGAKLVIDLGFDDLMTDKEIKSMTSQLGFCYAANRATTSPVHLLMTSFNGKLKDRMVNVGHNVWANWKGVEWWEEGYEELWEGETTLPPPTEEVIPSQENGKSTEPPSTSSSLPPPTSATTFATPAPPISLGNLTSKPRLRVPKSSIIYLTGDSPNILTSLDPSKTYIIGGIVDHNRYKSLCLNKAIEQGLEHAQLPIAEFMPELKSRKVITVNQVVEIVTKWTESRDWELALKETMPTRKLKEENSGKAGADGPNEVEKEEAEEVEDGEDKAAAVEQPLEVTPTEVAKEDTAVETL